MQTQKGKWRVGQLMDIPVFIHWSIVLIPFLILYIILVRQSSWEEILALCLIIFMLMFSVLAHELGHAFIAKRYNIIPTDLIFSPIGGLTRIPAHLLKGWTEIKIALAGPLVNFFIAFPLFVFLYFSDLSVSNFDPDQPLHIYNQIGLLYIFLFINGALFLFNLVPAFPMDGGRVVRAILGFFIADKKATQFAIYISFLVSTAIFLLAYYWSWYLLLIFAVVIYCYALIEFYKLKWNDTIRQKKAGPSFPPTNRPEEDLNT